MKKPLFILLSFLCSSCSTYQRHYSCPPGIGVTCKSVTEIEGMIEEKESGPDLFLPEKNVSKRSKKDKGACCLSQLKKGREVFSKEAPLIKRVWLRGHSTEAGHRVDGHYLYFALNDGEWFLGE